jgi:hypothetical protein
MIQQRQCSYTWMYTLPSCSYTATLTYHDTILKHHIYNGRTDDILISKQIDFHRNLPGYNTCIPWSSSISKQTKSRWPFFSHQPIGLPLLFQIRTVELKHRRRGSSETHRPPPAYAPGYIGTIRATVQNWEPSTFFCSCSIARLYKFKFQLSCWKTRLFDHFPLSVHIHLHLIPLTGIA